MKPTLRLVVSILTGLSVIIVAATVVGIASSIFTKAATDLGTTYAIQLGETGAGQTETFFKTQYDIMYNSRASIAMLDKLILSKDDPEFDYTSICTIMKSVFIISNNAMQTYTIKWADAAASTISQLTLPNGTEVFRCSFLGSYGIAPGGRGDASIDTTFDVKTNYEYNNTALFGGPTYLNYLVDPSDAGNEAIRLVTSLDFSRPWWATSLAYRRTTSEPPQLLFPLISAIFNSTGHYVGFIYSSISIKFLGDVLKGLDYNSKNSHSFAINNDGWILGTSHPNPTTTVRYQSSSAYYDNTKCRSTNDVISEPIAAIVCPILPSSFGFAPLAQLVAQDSQVYKTPKAFELDLDVDGEEYFVSGFKMNVPGRFFSVSMLFFIDFGDIVGSVTNARNIVIAVGAGMLVLGVISSLLALLVILKPLETVATKMNATSRLHMSDDGDDRSSNNGSAIQEIHSIELAYAQMHNAFDAFTKYVPIDIVKSLLTQGENFKMGVNPVYATMLYSDIQGYTSIMERNRPDEMSEALKVFFELMSTVIVQHEGLITQYIGDAIVAAWGALSSCEFQQVKACLAALMMTRETALPLLQQTFDNMGERIVVRLGINSGNVLSGTIGASSRIAFTVLGTPSDFASTLEALNKKYDTRVMIGPSVVEQVSEFFCLRALGYFDASKNGKLIEKKQQEPPTNVVNIADQSEENEMELPHFASPSADELENEQHSNKNTTASSSHPQQQDFEFSGYERIYELVGCLPACLVHLEDLKESKRRRTLTVLGLSGNLPSPKYVASPMSKNGNPIDSEFNNNTTEEGFSGLQRRNSLRSNSSSNSSSCSSDRDSDMASTLSSALRRTSSSSNLNASATTTAFGNENSLTSLPSSSEFELSSHMNITNPYPKRKKGKKRVRLSARALFELCTTGIPNDQASIVATELEVEFCNEFNAIVDVWNGIESSSYLSSASSSGKNLVKFPWQQQQVNENTKSSPLVRGGSGVGNNNYYLQHHHQNETPGGEENNNKNSKKKNLLLTSQNNNENDGRPSSKNPSLGRTNSGMVNMIPNCDIITSEEDSSDTALDENSNLQQQRRSSGSPKNTSNSNNNQKTKISREEEFYNLLMNLKKKYPSFFQGSLEDAEKLLVSENEKIRQQYLPQSSSSCQMQQSEGSNTIFDKNQNNVQIIPAANNNSSSNNNNQAAITMKRCSSSIMFSHQVVEQIFGRKISRALFREDTTKNYTYHYDNTTMTSDNNSQANSSNLGQEGFF